MIITTPQYKQSLPNNHASALPRKKGPRVVLGNPLHDSNSLSCSIAKTSLLLSYPERAGILNYEEGANTPSRTRPEAQASHTWASATVTGTLSTLSSVDLAIGRTLPDSANLTPGLYCSAYEARRTDPFLSELSLVRFLLLQTYFVDV